MVAYVSGIDFDVLLGHQAHDNIGEQYIGNYFTKKDIAKVVSDYESLIAQNPHQ
jgi:hypothetical protein